MNKKNLIIIALTLVVAVAFFSVTRIFIRKNNNLDESNTDLEETHETTSPFIEINNNIVSTRLAKDDIPPLENPKYVSIEDARFLEDSDKVFIMETNEGVYIYPRMIMVWHEIVNDIVDGESVSITYCPLTGSVIGYNGVVDGHIDNTYGTSGKLLNSNLVMYDRITDSDIPQILGIAINNSLEGNELNTFPIYWTDWESARIAYPGAFGLSIKTGYQREYFMDPYGSYDVEEKDSYYTTGIPMFDVINENDGTFTDKKIITGVKYQDNQIALDPDLIKAEKVVNFKIGDTTAVAFYDVNLETVRVYRIPSENLIEFKYENGRITDNTDTVWNITGTSENGNQLMHITHFDVMWFAWYAYYPETEVLK